MKGPTVHHEMGPSQLDRIAECPGSVAACRGLPEESSPAAEEGTMLHSLVWPDDTPLTDLTEEQKDAVSECRNFVRRLVEGIDDAIIMVEETLPYHDMFGAELLFGTADLIIRCPNDHAIVIDWKFGHTAVPPPHANLQIQTLCLMAARRYDLDSVLGVIFCPRQHAKQEFRFGRRELEQIEANLLDVVHAAQKETPPLHMNEYCRWCRARHTCPEMAKGAALMVMKEEVRNITAQNLGRRLTAARTIKPLIDQIEKEAIRRLRGGETVAGWQLKETSGDRFVSDANECFAQCHLLFSQEEFMQFVKVSMGKLEAEFATRYAQKHNATKKAAKAEFMSIMPIERGPAKFRLEKKEDD